MKARNAVLGILSSLAVALGVVGGLSGFPARHGLVLAGALGDASAVLFGVFGIWLGICYREEMHGQLYGKEGDELVRTAKGLVEASARCEVLFTGLTISSAVFVLSLLVRAVGPVLMECAALPSPARIPLKCAFLSLAAVGVVFQVYSIMTPIVIMAEAMSRLRDTRRCAEDILRRQEKY